MSSGPKQTDIVIVGAGLAGLFTALKLSPRAVTVVTSAPLGKGASSSWAQGGIAAAIEEGDTPFAHALDTMQAGAGTVNPEIAQILADEAASRIEDLLSYGAPFDRNLEGDLALSREAAHSARRIVRVKGDKAGWAIMSALIKAVRREPQIQIVEGFTAKALEMSGKRVTGVHVWSQDGTHLLLPASATVIAAGGVGALYKTTTNPMQANGEAMAMAAMAGAVLADTEFEQFHPTAIRSKSDPAPLATEALRGEGAVLINKMGERFMLDEHSDAELAPRDIVARAVFRENTSGRKAFLDCREAIGEKFPELFPSVYEKCKEAGIDPITMTIPVAPAAHFHMGGIFTDAFGRTTLDGLWACGEVASTGAHGANRLASNSLLEAVVFAARIAEDLARSRYGVTTGSPLTIKSSNYAGKKKTVIKKKHEKVVGEIRTLMDRHVGIERDKKGLLRALLCLQQLETAHKDHLTLSNMLIAARCITVTALLRKESRGSHFRSDYPEQDNRFARRTTTTMQQIDKHTHEMLF